MTTPLGTGVETPKPSAERNAVTSGPALIGVGTKESFAPPSEPNGRISRFRLSSWWLTFKKIGKPPGELVLRSTSSSWRSRRLANVDDPFRVRDLSSPSAFVGCCADVRAYIRRSVQRRSLFDQEIIVYCVRWYLTFKLSSRDLVQMMAERGITLTHTTILRWVQRYVPEFEKRWSRYARPAVLLR
jgi:hypothetical protein